LHSNEFSFSALTLLVAEWQEGHPACKRTLHQPSPKAAKPAAPEK